MEWRTIYHSESTDGKTEHITCELWLNFPQSRWNKNEMSPVLKIRYFDRKYETGWWLDNEKTKWWTQPPRKSCSMEFNYFQRQTEKQLYSEMLDSVSYEEFTLDYCKDYAINLFKKRLNDILNQLK